MLGQAHAAADTANLGFRAVGQEGGMPGTGQQRELGRRQPWRQLIRQGRRHQGIALTLKPEAGGLQLGQPGTQVGVQQQGQALLQGLRPGRRPLLAAA